MDEVGIGGGRTWCRQFARLNLKLSIENLKRILKQPALGWSRCARAVFVVGAAVTRTHEQSRLRKPSDRASEVGAIDREHLELVAVDVSYPARNFRRLSIG